MQMKLILCTQHRILFISIVVGVSVLYYDICIRTYVEHIIMRLFSISPYYFRHENHLLHANSLPYLCKYICIYNITHTVMTKERTHYGD